MRKIPSYVWIIITLVVSIAFLLILVANASTKPTRIEQNLYDMAQSLNMDIDKFKTDFKSDSVRKAVEDEKNDALSRLGNNAATPAIFIDGQLYQQDYTNLQAVLNDLVKDRKDTDPKLKVEEFSDYYCSHCLIFETIALNIKKDTVLMEKIDFEQKHLPFLNASSILYAYAAEATKLQGKFDEMSVKLFEDAQNTQVELPASYEIK